MTSNWVQKAEGQLLNVVESKVKAASTTAALVGIATTELGLYVFHGAVPDWATGAVGGLVTGALSFVAGWLAKHTPRTPAAPPTAAPPVDPAS
ncbi:hypothetical protein [Amycolatopsis vancoresmycina]|uniref:hypothetical protein n=1 Tax=Amycolatopsis vancoresmycina TaxID=208444 RepID=UPI0005251FB8|nr:hypothetical protein [Amycolatopsis vancoresmycina]